MLSALCHPNLLCVRAADLSRMRIQVTLQLEIGSMACGFTRLMRGRRQS
jgi:hypothetical protein